MPQLSDSINTFKYCVLCTNGKISVRIIYLLFYFIFFLFPVGKKTQLLNRTTVEKYTIKINNRKENITIEWDDGGKIVNRNK